MRDSHPLPYSPPQPGAPEGNGKEPVETRRTVPRGRKGVNHRVGAGLVPARPPGQSGQTGQGTTQASRAGTSPAPTSLYSHFRGREPHQAVALRSGRP